MLIPYVQLTGQNGFEEVRTDNKLGARIGNKNQIKKALSDNDAGNVNDPKLIKFGHGLVNDEAVNGLYPT